MSISVKSISVSINDAVSKQFNIELDGVKYSLDEFKLTQKLLEPCKLEFKLCKTPEESINEIQFTTCGSIIGKDVKLSLQTNSMEQEISGFATGSQNSDIEFEGFITSARASRKGSEYAIRVVAQTKDVVLKDAPDFEIYNEMTLSDIVNDVLKRTSVKAEVQPKKEDALFFTVQYNENNYQFLQRQAQRHGEWMFNNGKELHFGKFSHQDSITLTYPSQDLPEYSASLQTFHVKHHFFQFLYNDIGIGHGIAAEKQNDTGNKLNDLVFKASNDNWQYNTGHEIESLHMERDEDAKKGSDDDSLFREASNAFKQGRRANMLIYKGKSYCSQMKIGTKLTIKDNYISNESSEDKSVVQQDEILITEVVHRFTSDELYSNFFKGITAAIDYPPYLDPTIHPVCNHPLRAFVVDTEDPKHWGRVKVRFNMPAIRHQTKTDPKYWTPWIHVVQPYTGNSGKSSKFGTHLIPELFSEVYVGFDGGNFERPFVYGSHYGPAVGEVEDSWYPGNNNVKAIRTSSGHTIEIHDNMGDEDYNDGGFIKIYDNDTHNYEVLLSTDSKLIKLKSKGNIELSADNDIIMTAGHNIKVTAKNDMTVDVTHQKTEKSENFKQTVTETTDVKSKTIKQNASEVTCDATQSLKVTTPNASVKAGAQLTLKSGGSASISSGGTLIVEGALISMN